MERSGWAAAVGTLYKLRDGRTVKITEYRVCDFEPASGAQNHAAGLNEFVEGVLVNRAKDEPGQRFTWGALGVCGECMTEVLVDEPQPGYRAGEWKTGPYKAAYDLMEAIRGGRRT